MIPELRWWRQKVLEFKASLHYGRPDLNKQKQRQTRNEFLPLASVFLLKEQQTEPEEMLKDLSLTLVLTWAEWGAPACGVHPQPPCFWRQEDSQGFLGSLVGQ